ncbi:MAG: hypothetical protein UHP11_04075, partial [Anaerovoracaceae bacterium]|nr:hypothetical protein [Anaerovoracaceae bacterium]
SEIKSGFVPRVVFFSFFLITAKSLPPLYIVKIMADGHHLPVNDRSILNGDIPYTFFMSLYYNTLKAQIAILVKYGKKH